MPFLSAPDFWARDGSLARLLQPFAWAYATAGAINRARTHPWRAPVPVVCVGNFTVGGAGKTPVVLSLAQLLKGQGRRVHLLSRGYGGSLAGPVSVDRTRHGAAEVGDEPLLLAETAPTWVARDRVAGAKAAIAAGAEVLVLDDGFQSSALAKDLSLVVVDGGYGVGNGRVLPAGPLREPLADGLRRADAVIVMGAIEEAMEDLLPRLAGKPTVRARLEPEFAAGLKGKRVIAFAGIGRPAKFFAMLEHHGIGLIARHAFPDHHPYKMAELNRMLSEAEAAETYLLTTGKDAVRLPQAFLTSSKAAARVIAVPVSVAWDDTAALAQFLDGAMRARS